MDFSEKLKQLFAKILEEEELSFGDMFEKFHKDFEELVPEGRKFQPEDMYTMFSYKEIVACLINYGPLFHVKKITDKKLKIENCNGILFRAFCSLQNAILPLKDEARISPNQLIGSASIIFAQACKRGGVNYRVFYNREAFCVYPERLTIRDLGARADRASWKMVNQNLLTGEKKTFQIPTNSGKKTFITPKDLSAWAIKNLEHGRFWASLCAVLPTWEVAMVMGYYEEAGHEVTDDAKTIIGRAIHNVYEGEPSKLEKKIADKFTMFGLSNPPKEVDGEPVAVSGKTVYELLDTLYVHKGEGKYPVIDDITKRDMNTGFNA